MTLLELVIALAISSVLMAAIYLMVTAQAQDQAGQEASVQMMQGLRAAVVLMTQEIETAGCNPLGITPQNAATPWTDPNYPQILVADQARLQFTRDITGGQHDGIDNDHDGVVDNPEEDVYPDGKCADADENITYYLDQDANGDGINDNIVNGTAWNLVRESCPEGVSSAAQILAPNIDALNFVYLDSSGNVIPTPVPNNLLNTISQVQITIVARAGHQLRGLMKTYKDTTNYKNQQGTVILPAPNDSFPRIRLTTTVDCRNLAKGM